MNKRLFIVLLLGCMTYFIQAQKSPIAIGHNIYSYVSDDTLYSGIIGEAYLGAHDTLAVGGNIYTIGFPYRMMYTEDAFKGDLFASKGYYSDYVMLKWEIYNPDNVSQIKIYRRGLSDTDESYRLVATTASTATSWQDEFAEPGQMYKYKVLADDVWAEEIIGLNVVEGVGFRVTSATVTGRVTYAGGSVVEGVKLRVEPDIPTADGKYAYHFPEVVDGNHILVRPTTHDDFSEGVTIQSWIKPAWVTGKEIYPIFSMGTSLSVGIVEVDGYVPIDTLTSPSLYYFAIQMGGDVALSPVLTDSVTEQYMQVSLVWNPSTSTTTLYLNGEFFFSKVFSGGVGNSNWYIGGSVFDSDTHTFSGYMDEVRLWSKAMTANEVYETYDTYVSPNNDDLSGYWRLDEGGGKNFYDVSRLNTNFNENEGIEISQINDYEDNFTQDIPSPRRLGNSAVTDENGNYVVAGIAYASGGSYYSVTASKGVHQFDPADKLLYISKESSVFNNVDFTDISAFKVRSSVFYAGTKVPVSDVYIYVDGSVVVDSKKQPVKTDASGEFEIDVPIGLHDISVHKGGHEFESAYWPGLDSYGNPIQHDFQDDYPDVDVFQDTTRITLVGKVVGGPIQGDKVTGSKVDPSVNNLGIVAISFKLESGKELWDNSITYDVFTDPVTGVYQARLLPESFILASNIMTIGTEGDGYVFDRVEDNTTIDLSNKFYDEYTIDSVFRDTVIDDEMHQLFDYLDTVLTYNHSRDWVWRATANISVASDKDSLFWGEETYEYRVNDDSVIILDCVTKENDGSYTYDFGYAIFRQFQDYGLKVRAVEEYINADNGDLDPVPVTDGEVEVENQVALETNSEVIPLDSDGEALHVFKGGSPVVADPFLKNINFKLKVDGFYVSGAEVSQSCYALGVKPKSGMNFVTGPDEIDFILRDPPGSDSYAYFEEGFTSSKTITSSSSFGFGGDLDILHMFGTKVTTEVGGFGFALETSVEVENTVGLSTSHERVTNDDNSFSESKTYNFSYSTSADPAYVGEMGDVFFGHGTNIYYGAADNIRILKEDSVYQVGNKLAVTIDKKSSTEFVYSYNHIENYLIPDLEKLRNELFDSVIYISHLGDDDDNYGLSNYDAAFEKAPVEETDDYIDGPSYKFLPQDNGDDNTAVDEVEEYNKMIRNWKLILAQNEMLKQTADDSFDDHNDYQNISFDAGASVESSITTDQSIEHVSTMEWTLDAGVALELGFSVNKFGMKVVGQERLHWGGGSEEEDEEETSKTVGFVLADGDQGDYFSIDVKKDVFYDAPVFILRGGQSSCPYEKAEYTKYLNEEFKVDLLSMADEKVADKAKDLSWEDKVDLIKDGTEDGDEEVDPEDLTFEDFLGEYSTSEKEDAVEPFHDLKYKEGEEITKGTMKIESPEIRAEESVVSNVPEGSSAVFTVYLANTSDVGADVWYGLFLDAASNPDGAVVKVDGMPLVGGISVMVPAGATVTKTVTVDKGRDEVNDYEDLAVIIHSLCQFDPTDDLDDISDTTFLTAHFIPECTEVYISSPLDQWIVNINDKDVNDDYKLPVKIEGYNLNHSTLTSINFQYKPVSQSQWITAQTFIDGMSGEDTTDIQGNSSVSYQWDMTKLDNMEYDIRVVSVCHETPTSEAILYESSVLTGTLDNKPPLLFGAPQPADEVLSAGDEIILTFDEDIQAGLLTSQNISITGVRNGTDLKDVEYLLHDVSLHFDGIDQNMTIPQDINLKYMPFTVEFWASRESLGEECLISQGDPNNGGLWIGFDTSDRLVAKCNGELVYSNNTYTTLGIFNHYAFVFDNTPTISGNELSLIIASGDQDDNATQTIDLSYYGNAPISVGYCPANSTAFKGRMHSLRLWNEALTSSDIVARRYTLLNGYERGLIGAWSMKEAFGDIAQDIALSRHAQVDATWSVSKDGVSLDCADGYAEFTTSTMELTSSTDFTLELWFKSGIPADTAYLLSNGEADYMTLTDKWAVMVLPDGQMLVRNDATDYLIDAGYLDNNWHHLAISVNRRSNINLLLDGEIVLTQSVTPVSGMGSDKCVLGGRYFKVNSSVTTVDKNFEGMIDEFRIWNSAKSIDLIKDLMNYSLRGDEMGLKAYFPLEPVNVNDSLANQTLDSMGVAGNALRIGARYSSEKPFIKMAKPESNINFSYVVNGNQVLITPTEYANSIENTTLNIALEGAYDLFGNRMPMTANWLAFVDKNQLLWSASQVDLECTQENVPEFTMMVLNNGGSRENWQIENLPVWLSADMTQGTLDPQSYVEVTFAVDPAINVGKYSHDIYLNGSMDYNERCNVNLNVSNPAPEWSVSEHDFEHTMVVIGKLKIADEYSTDINDEVAAFYGDECRGVANVEYVQDRDFYYVNLVIYGNASDQLSLDLKVWDSSTGNIHSEVTPGVIFEVNDIVGTVGNPVIISTSDEVAAEILVQSGWNWMSFNQLSSQLHSSDSLFASLASGDGDQVKYKTSFDDYVSGLGWGNMMTYEYGKMYKLYATDEGVVEVSGTSVTTSSVLIELVRGWNWIGYTPQFKMPLSSAMSYHTPAQDDVIKSQSQFAMYDQSLGWVGSLDYMTPFEGYMYYSNNTDSVAFKYPQQTLFTTRSAKIQSPIATPSVSEYNMSALLSVANQSLVEGKSTKVLAMSNGKVCGEAEAINVDGKALYPITIVGDASEYSLAFVLVDVTNASSLEANEVETYQVDKVLGTISSPFELSFNNVEGAGAMEATVMPNPFSESLTIANIPSDVNRVEIIDLQGKVVKSWDKPNREELVWDGRADAAYVVSQGVYLLKLYGVGDYKPQLIIKE